MYDHPPRLIARKIVIMERESEQVIGNFGTDALEVVRLPIAPQGATDEADLLLNDSLNGGPRTVINLGRCAFNTTVSLSARLLAMLIPEG
jgi:hypothetical protein